MNCERELITAAVAATAPLTIIKYKVTLILEMTMFIKIIFSTIYLGKQEKFLINPIALFFCPIFDNANAPFLALYIY